MIPLPCFPCPHKAVCCSFGVSLSADEAANLQANFDGSTRWVDGEYRTAVIGGRCFFQSDDGRCSIHDTEFYPLLCAGFPFSNGVGGRYEGDPTLCPEICLQAPLNL